MEPRDDGSLLIDGSFPIDELAERLAIVLPAGHDFQTLAGFALAEMRRLPGSASFSIMAAGASRSSIWTVSA